MYVTCHGQWKGWTFFQERKSAIWGVFLDEGRSHSLYFDFSFFQNDAAVAEDAKILTELGCDTSALKFLKRLKFVDRLLSFVRSLLDFLIICTYILIEKSRCGWVGLREATTDVCRFWCGEIWGAGGSWPHLVPWTRALGWDAGSAVETFFSFCCGCELTVPHIVFWGRLLAWAAVIVH